MRKIIVVCSLMIGSINLYAMQNPGQNIGKPSRTPQKMYPGKITTYSEDDVAQLFDKIRIDDVAGVKAILDRFPENKKILRHVNQNGDRPLHQAFRLGNMGMISLLVSVAKSKGVLREILKPTLESPESLISAATNSENLDAIYTAVRLEGAYRIPDFYTHLDAALSKAQRQDVKKLLENIKGYLASNDISSEYKRSIFFERKAPTREAFLLLKTGQQGASSELSEEEILLDEQPVWSGRKTK